MVNFLYMDTSAAIKLFKQEEESEALREWLVSQTSARQITAHLTRTELHRGLHRAGAQPETLELATIWLNRCARIALAAELLTKAGNLAPGASLRTLDAIHVAAALELGAALTYFVAYDKNLIAAAEAHGLTVVAPT
ncbi:type II toxin-antitoxin system VapC family toxin [Nocardia gipuzkoensis]|uniref:type II toxin-antitoxin system VapC family toxin n=1 Tax=Nocardia TaxID=1817 RepID=UPI00237EB368|nr:type II toxin-antitoxin system VapC family toxin [Nocardia gipuzkoensis]MDE1675182.1 type II toxin-antitoxin system VapC family toxin [Nocardia gipuzkoensis]